MLVGLADEMRANQGAGAPLLQKPEALASPSAVAYPRDPHCGGTGRAFLKAAQESPLGGSVGVQGRVWLFHLLFFLFLYPCLYIIDAQLLSTNSTIFTLGRGALRYRNYMCS